MILYAIYESTPTENKLYRTRQLLPFHIIQATSMTIFSALVFNITSPELLSYTCYNYHNPCIFDNKFSNLFYISFHLLPNKQALRSFTQALYHTAFRSTGRYKSTEEEI
ncbi:hypothetical protein ACMFMG_010806 [Clarireedia jacksonii]